MTAGQKNQVATAPEFDAVERLWLEFMLHDHRMGQPTLVVGERGGSSLTRLVVAGLAVHDERMPGQPAFRLTERGVDVAVWLADQPWGDVTDRAVRMGGDVSREKTGAAT